MKNKGIVIFLIILTIVIVTVVTLDYYSSKPDELPENPYALNLTSFEKVDNGNVFLLQVPFCFF